MVANDSVGAGAAAGVGAGPSAALVGDVAAGIGTKMGSCMESGARMVGGRGIGVGAWMGAGVEVRLGLIARSTASVVGGGVGAKVGDVEVDCGLFLFVVWALDCGRLESRLAGGGRELSADAGVLDVG